MKIYIHIPFCEQKCGYCRFASVGNTQNFLIEKYVRYLCKEISQSSCAEEIDTLYFGGGTPGVLSNSQLEKIFQQLKKQFKFSKNIEITLETTPDKITKLNLTNWEKLGINRVSMGVQTLNSKSLQIIGRAEKAGNILEKLDILEMFTKSYKPKTHYEIDTLDFSISIDFIIGLPGVREGEIKENISHILDNYSCIKHISVYMLEDYYNEDKVVETIYDKKTYPENWDELGIAEDKYLEEYSSIKQYLNTQGFGCYEISNYAKVGYECQHNLGYWNHSEMLAFGLGAYGFLKNSDNQYYRYSNSEIFNKYYNGEQTIQDTLTDEDFFLETLMFQLRTSGLEKNVYQKLNQEKLEYYLVENYLEKKSDKIILSDRGVLVMDYLLKELV